MSKNPAQGSLSKVGASCFIPRIIVEPSQVAAECVSEHGKSQCADINGECVTERDGYYWVSGLCLMFGVAFLLGYIIPTVRRLQGEFSVTPFILRNI